MAKLYFTFSAMNAGKSALLLQASYNYRERGMETMLWTSHHHASEPGSRLGTIESRLGLNAEAHLFDAETAIFQAIREPKDAHGLDATFVDEAQFLSQEQVWQLARTADDLKIPVLCYGLRTDFRGQLFEGAAALLAIADHLREARTICHCGRKATMTLRRDSDGATIREGEQIGVEKSVYVSLCRMHWLKEIEG